MIGVGVQMWKVENAAHEAKPSARVVQNQSLKTN